MKKEDARALCRFLIGFREPDRQFVKWEGGLPIYDEDVWQFFDTIAYSEWKVSHHDTKNAAYMIRNPDAIRSCDMKQIEGLLQHCWRCERFGYGSWAKLLSDGIIQVALQRLEELVEL